MQISHKIRAACIDRWSSNAACSKKRGPLHNLFSSDAAKERHSREEDHRAGEAQGLQRRHQREDGVGRRRQHWDPGQGRRQHWVSNTSSRRGLTAASGRQTDTTIGIEKPGNTVLFSKTQCCKVFYLYARNASVIGLIITNQQWHTPVAQCHRYGGKVHVRVTLCFNAFCFIIYSFTFIYLSSTFMFVCVAISLQSPCVMFVYHILPGAAFRATSAWPPRWGTKASVRCGEKGSDFISNNETPHFIWFVHLFFSLPSFPFLLCYLLLGLFGAHVFFSCSSHQALGRASWFYWYIWGFS